MIEDQEDSVTGFQLTQAKEPMRGQKEMVAAVWDIHKDHVRACAVKIEGGAANEHCRDEDF